MFFIAIILGLIEGVTEFLPVSSTGHLILFGDMLGFKGPEGKSFEIIVQLGAILAVCWCFRSRIIALATGTLLRKSQSMRLTAGIVLAVIPAMVVGAIFHHWIKAVLFNPVSVSTVLIIGGILILLIERFKPAPRTTELEQLTLSTCLKIGLCQCLALVPGTSRSGATIMGALLMRIDRKTAAEFSFLLSIPTMIAATTFQLYSDWSALTTDGLELIAAGFIVAFLSGMAVIRLLMRYIISHDFAVFAWYRIALGSLMLILLMS